MNNFQKKALVHKSPDLEGVKDHLRQKCSLKSIDWTWLENQLNSAMKVSNGSYVSPKDKTPVGNGGIFNAILQPEANIGNAEVKHLQSLKSIIENLSLDDDEYIYYSKYKSFPIIYSLLIEEMRNYDYMIDMTNAFDGNEYIYIDHAHVTANGNMIIANKIANLIKEISN